MARLRAMALAAALLAPASAFGADLAALEQAVRRASAVLQRTTADRDRLMAEAGRLADEITRLKERSVSGVRADPALEEALKRFDRLAARLDLADAKESEQERAVRDGAKSFEDAASAEAARLSANAGPGSVGEVARELESIEEARRRVAQLASHDSAFRPVLDVALSPGDGVTDVEAKLQLLDAERRRVENRMSDIAAEDDLLAARASLKKQLLGELQAASRAAGPDLALLRREADEATDALAALTSRREALAKERERLSAALHDLALRKDQFQERLQRLQPRGDPR